MFNNKSARVTLEGFSQDQTLAAAVNLATSPSFANLTFGVTGNVLTVKGPRQSVDTFIAVAKSL